MIKILFLAANPTNTTRLRVDEESRAMDEILCKLLATKGNPSKVVLVRGENLLLLLKNYIRNGRMSLTRQPRERSK